MQGPQQQLQEHLQQQQPQHQHPMSPSGYVTCNGVSYAIVPMSSPESPAAVAASHDAVAEYCMPGDGEWVSGPGDYYSGYAENQGWLDPSGFGPEGHMLSGRPSPTCLGRDVGIERGGAVVPMHHAPLDYDAACRGSYQQSYEASTAPPAWWA